MKKETLKAVKRNTRKFKAPPTKVHTKRKEVPMYEVVVFGECCKCGRTIYEDDLYAYLSEWSDAMVCEDCE